MGEYVFELKALQYHFGIQPCRYPAQAEWGLSPIGDCAQQPFSLSLTGAGAMATLGSLFEKHGLSRCLPLFEAKEIDLEAFASMLGDGDYHDVGVTDHADIGALKAIALGLRAEAGAAEATGAPAAACVSSGALTAAAAPRGARADCRHLDVFSVDNASTRDVDDALSFDFTAGSPRVRVGIHIADVASRLPCSSPLFKWAKVRKI